MFLGPFGGQISKYYLCAARIRWWANVLSGVLVCCFKNILLMTELASPEWVSTYYYFVTNSSIFGLCFP